jgi:hypothetical protein
VSGAGAAPRLTHDQVNPASSGSGTRRPNSSLSTGQVVNVTAGCRIALRYWSAGICMLTVGSTPVVTWTGQATPVVRLSRRKISIKWQIRSFSCNGKVKVTGIGSVGEGDLTTEVMTSANVFNRR